MGFVCVEQIESAVAQERANLACRRQAEHCRRHLVHIDSSSPGATAKRRSLCSEKLCGMAAFIQSLQEQQGLALPSAPLGLQVHNQGNHPAPCEAFFFSACTKAPNFANFKRTPRAAICEITAPR